MYSRLTISSLMINKGRFLDWKNMRSTYSPIIPRASSCTPLNNMITKSKEVKPSITCAEEHFLDDNSQKINERDQDSGNPYPAHKLHRKLTEIENTIVSQLNTAA
jgi:hypothetical protein